MNGVLIAVASIKGAPGVTTMAVGLAAVWPRPGAVLVECDPAGGDLWARFGHHPNPGLSGLAAATLQRGNGQAFLAHQQRLAVGANVVLAVPGDGAAASVHTLAQRGIGLLRQAATAAPVLLDVGRLDPHSPSFALASAADHVLLMARPDLAEQTQVGARLPWLVPNLSGQLWLVPAGAGRLATGEIARDLGIPVIGNVPRSRWGAGVLCGQLHVPNWRRLGLGRAIAAIAAVLAAAGPAPMLALPPRRPMVVPVVRAPQHDPRPAQAPR